MPPVTPQILLGRTGTRNRGGPREPAHNLILPMHTSMTTQNLDTIISHIKGNNHQFNSISPYPPSITQLPYPPSTIQYNQIIQNCP